MQSEAPKAGRCWDTDNGHGAALGKDHEEGAIVMELKVSGEQSYFVSMNPEQGSYFPIGMYSMPLSSTLKMVNFMLCVLSE